MSLTLQDEFWWGDTRVLPSWAGYQSRFGPYTSIDKPAPSDGKVKLRFAPDGRGTDPLTTSELKLLSWFETHEPDVSAAVKRSILTWCQPFAAEPVTDEDDLKRHIGLYSVNVHQLLGDVPYIGYEFGCNWEEEHGLGVMMHGTRLAAIGDADTALHLWVAQKDADGVD
jgi:hypothetical protein